MDTALAIDIGGTKMAVARVDADGRLTDRRAAPTPGQASAEFMWEVLVDLVDEVRRDDELVVGVGCGGPMTPGGERVSPLNIPAWRDFPLKARLAELTGLGVHVDNDAKALARGEGWVGAARGERDFIAMVVSTGACSRAPPATPATSGTSSSSPRAGCAPAGPGAAWRPRRRGRRSSPPPA